MIKMMARSRRCVGCVKRLALFACIVVGAAVQTSPAGASTCVERFNGGAPIILASFDNAAAFANGVNDVGGALGDSGTMAQFARTPGGSGGTGAALTLVAAPPPAAPAAWAASVPAAATTVPMTEAVGAVVAFELGAADPAKFSVTIGTRDSASASASATETRTLPVAAYVSAAASGGWTTVQIPVQHFVLPPRRALVSITFSGFAVGVPVHMDTVRIEYHSCPRRAAVVPVQTCNPTTPALLVDDFSNAARFASRTNAMGAPWSDDGTMATMERLGAGSPNGPGLHLVGNETAYWYSLLRGPDSRACVDPWPYTTLRVVVAASRGLQFDVGLSRGADDCVTPVTINAVRVESVALAQFTGLANPVTLDIPLGLLPRNPITAIAIAGLYRAPGAPTDGTTEVVLHSVAFVRDCARLATEATESVPAIIDGCGPSDVPLVTLSFDGPSNWDDGILDYLNSRGIKATFFVQPGSIIDRPEVDPSSTPPIGSSVDFDAYGYPLQQPASSEICRIIRRMASDGHDLGDHSYTHPRFSSLYEGQLVAEIERPQVFYSNCLGYAPTKFRPPYGELTPAQVVRMNQQNYSIVQWNLESNDHLPNTNILNNIMAGVTMYQKSHSGGLPFSTMMLSHEMFTNVALPSIVDYFNGLGYQFITIEQCRERCIDRAYPDQPAALADHRGCWNPRNPSDYMASQLMFGQWWLKGVPMSTAPVPPTLGPTYAFMAPPTEPFVAPTVVPGLAPTATASAPTTAAPTTAAPTTSAPTTAVPTTAAPTTAAPTTAGPTTTTGPTSTTAAGPCSIAGTTLTIQPGQGIGCVEVYTAAQYKYLLKATVTGGAASAPASALRSATSLIVEAYANPACTTYARSFTCTVGTSDGSSSPPTLPPTVPPTVPPTATTAPTTASTTAPTMTATMAPTASAGLGCMRSGGQVVVYNLPPSTACVLGYVLPSYRLVLDAAAVAPSSPSVVFSGNGVAAGQALRFEIYSGRAGVADCAGLLATTGCTV